MNFEDIKLSKINQSQKDKYHKFPLMLVKFIETESRRVVSKESGELLFNGNRVSIW